MEIKFLAKLAGVTLAIAVATIVLIYFAQPQETYWYWIALGFYTVVGVVIGKRSQRAVLSASNSTFFTGVIGAIGIRLLLCVLFLAIYLIISDLKSKTFIIYYLILYLFYTIFEITQLVSKLRPEKSTSLDNTTS